MAGEKQLGAPLYFEIDFLNPIIIHTMNPTTTEVKTLKVALFALALGTMVEGFSQGLNFLGSGFWGIVGATLVALVFVTLFDLTATKNLFRVAKHHTKQEPLGKRVWIFYAAMVLGLVGTMAFSLLSVPVITDVSVGDTDADKVMMQQKQGAEARHKSARNDAERIYKDAQARVKKAQEYVAQKGKFSPAKTDAIKAQGGDFASLALSGNSWVWTSDAPYSKQIKEVARIVALAESDLQAAKAELEEMRKMRAGVVSSGAVDNATAMILSTQKQRFEQWTSKRATTRTVTLVIVWGSLIVVLISVIAQAAQGKVDEVRTISDVAADALEGIHDAFIEIMDAGNAGAQWLRSKTFGFVAHQATAPAPIPATLPPVAPSAYNVTPAIVTPTTPFVTGQQTGQNTPGCHKNKTKAKRHVTSGVTKKQRDTVPISKRTDDQLLASRRKALQRDKAGKLKDVGKRNLSRYEAELSRRGYNFENRKP